MPEWPQDELDQHAAWFDTQVSEENLLGFLPPDPEQVEAMLEKMAFA